MDVAHLRLFASAREAAGTAHDVVPGVTVNDVLLLAVSRFGSEFAMVLATSRVWVNGEQALGTTLVNDSDEVAVLPPVSGGAL